MAKDAGWIPRLPDRRRSRRNQNEGELGKRPVRAERMSDSVLGMRGSDRPSQDADEGGGRLQRERGSIMP